MTTYDSPDKSKGAEKNTHYLHTKTALHFAEEWSAVRLFRLLDLNTKPTSCRAVVSWKFLHHPYHRMRIADKLNFDWE